MSELKDYDIMDIEAMDNERLEKSESGRIQTTRVYIKSEADNVIAELKKERDWLAKDRAQAYDDLEKRAQLNIKQEDALRRHKYKRCLAMAMWLAAMSVIISTIIRTSQHINQNIELNTIQSGICVGSRLPSNLRRRSDVRVLR